MPVKFACFFLASSFFISMISCSKKDQSTPAPPVKNCRIASATLAKGPGSKVVSYTFQYDIDGKLVENTYSGLYDDTMRFSYIGNMIFSTFSSSIYSSFDTIKLNTSGLIEYQKESGTDATYLTNYTYSANMELQSVIVHQDPYPSDSIFYSFTNGDATFKSEGTSTDSMTYDLSKPAVHGNMDEFTGLLSNGALFIKNKHLIASVKHYNSVSPASNSVTTFNYEYTPEGNISSIQETTGNNMQVINYVYNCN